MTLAGTGLGLMAPASRDQAAGWDTWRRARHGFAPAPVRTFGQWRAMSTRERSAYDLHRMATHANLPLLDTPMSQRVDRLLSARIRTNAFKAKPSTRAGVMISGGGYQGKTETTCEIVAAFEDSWRALHHQVHPDVAPGTRDLWVPVAYVQTPVTAKPKSTCKAILKSTGRPQRTWTSPT
ncbi:hypothetical protein [Streptomyces sp. NPDC046385]|uniref:hypothetical protein n=1 Tax=Streptomyces sp. NPDC046385 TaxID=3154918 RepID=UPI0033D4E032